MTLYALCPRCGGPLYEGEDYAGRYRSCLNCGFLDALDGYDPEGKRHGPRRNQAGSNRKGKLRGMTPGQRGSSARYRS